MPYADLVMQPQVQRIIMSLARRFSDNSEDFLDYVQEGNIGALKAAKRFNTAEGTAFHTYAYLWIKKMIRQARMEKNLVHVPWYKQIKRAQWNRIATRVYARTGQCIELVELEDDVDLVADMGPVAGYAYMPFEQLHLHELADMANKVGARLKPRHAKLLRMHAKGIAFKAIGKTLGCSGTRVGELHQRIVARIRAQQPKPTIQL